jgi:sortase A
MLSKSTSRVLQAFSVGLFALGVILIGWTAWTLLDSQYVQWRGTREIDRAIASKPLPKPAAHTAKRPEVVVNPPRGSVIGKLEIPRLKMSLVVLEGTDDRTLAKSIGHVETTGRPGSAGNVGIAGHRDQHFRPLERIRDGDDIVLTTAEAQQFYYRVQWIRIVNPEDVYVLDQSDSPALTLITCFPFKYVGHAPHRFIVRGVPDQETRTRFAAAANLRSGG